MGSRHTRVWDPSGSQIADLETVVAVDITNDSLAQIGAKARQLFSERSGSFRLEYPFQRGITGAVDRLVEYLRTVLFSVGVKSASKTRLAISIPSDLSQMERDVISNALSSLGTKEILLVPATLAGILGAGIDPTVAEGSMVLLMGASFIEASIFALGESAAQHSIQAGGNDLSERLIKHLLDSYGVVVSLEVAEEIVDNLLDLSQVSPSRLADVWGRDGKTGEAKQARITEAEVIRLGVPLVQGYFEAAVTTLAHCQPELVADVGSRGIHLIGGCSNLPGVGAALVQRCNVNVTIPKAPETAVVRGLAEILRKQPKSLAGQF